MRNALARSGLTQDLFAVAIGTSSSRYATYKTGGTIPSATLYLRALRIADALAQGHANGLMSAPDAAKAIGDALDAGDEDWAWRMLLQGRDHLRLVLSEHQDAVASWEATPKSTGRTEWDILLAAITRREFARSAAPTPEWANPDPLARPWIPEHPFLTSDEVIEQTPEFLRNLQIFIPANDLVTA